MCLEYNIPRPCLAGRQYILRGLAILLIELSQEGRYFLADIENIVTFHVVGGICFSPLIQPTTPLSAPTLARSR